MVLVGGIVYIRQIHMYMYGTNRWYSIYISLPSVTSISVLHISNIFILDLHLQTDAAIYVFIPECLNVHYLVEMFIEVSRHVPLVQIVHGINSRTEHIKMDGFKPHHCDGTTVLQENLNRIVVKVLRQTVSFLLKLFDHLLFAFFQVWTDLLGNDSHNTVSMSLSSFALRKKRMNVSRLDLLLSPFMI